jgi:hypothetical protein
MNKLEESLKPNIDSYIEIIISGKFLSEESLDNIKNWSTQNLEFNEIYTTKFKFLKMYYHNLEKLNNEIKYKNYDERKESIINFSKKSSLQCQYILTSLSIKLIQDYSQSNTDLVEVTDHFGVTKKISSKYKDVYKAANEKHKLLDDELRAIYKAKRIDPIIEKKKELIEKRIEELRKDLTKIMDQSKEANAGKKILINMNGDKTEIAEKFKGEWNQKLLELGKLKIELKKLNEDKKETITTSGKKEETEEKKITFESKERILDAYEKSKVKEVAKKQGKIKSFGRRVLYGIKTFKDPTLEERVSLSEYVKNPTVVKEEEIHEVQKRKSKDKNKLSNRAKAWIVTGVTAISLFTGIGIFAFKGNNKTQTSQKPMNDTAYAHNLTDTQGKKSDTINGAAIVYDDSEKENTISLGSMVTLKENAKIYSSAMAAEFNENSNVPLYAGDQEVLAIQYKLNDGGYKTIYSNNDNKNIEGRIVAVAVKAVGTNNGYTGWFNINDITMKEGLSR